VDKERSFAEAKEDLEIFKNLQKTNEAQTEGGLMENLEFFSGYLPLNAMCERFLHFVAPKARGFDMQKRPLSADKLLAVVHETQAILMVADHLKRRGFVPQEILG
jgi:hypothetical protein